MRTFAVVAMLASWANPTGAEVTAEQEALVDLIQNPPDVHIVGDDGKPTEAFPLKLCQGDCDYDKDVRVPCRIHWPLLSVVSY